jgi:outer membrane murein-binding lipoprotein Lpp
MSNLNYQEQALLNSVSEQCRTLSARLDDQAAKMNAFREEAMRLLLQMAEANKPKGNTTT